MKFSQYKMDIEHLVNQLKQKDITAFEKLYEHYSVNICGAIYSIVRNSKLAQELTNDVFVKIWENAESYDVSKGRFFTWILKIARNTAIDVVRSKAFKQESVTQSFDDYSSHQLGEKGIQDIADTREIKAFLPLGNLKHIEIIDLIYFKGYTQKQVADELAIPLSTVKSRSRNCLSELRSMREFQEWI